MSEDSGTEASIAYRSDLSDLRAAALVAARVLPVLVRIRRWARYCVATVLLLWIVLLLRLMDGSGSAVTVALLAIATPVGIALLSPRFYAFHITRNPISRRGLGDATFTADATGITTSVGGTSGTFTWPAIERVAETNDNLLFMISPQLFNYVPARILSEADRATIRHLAHAADDGPEWLDLRVRRP